MLININLKNYLISIDYNYLHILIYYSVLYIVFAIQFIFFKKVLKKNTQFTFLFFFFNTTYLLFLLENYIIYY